MEEKEKDQPAQPSGSTIIDWVWKFLASVQLALALILIISAVSLIGALKPDLNIFRSRYFLLVGTLLMINVIVCSLNRWQNIKLSLQGGKIQQNENFYSVGTSHTEIPSINLLAGDAVKVSQRVLNKLGYRVRAVNEKDVAYIAADKNRYFRLGTYVSHLSLVLFVLAYLLGGYLGFQQNDFAVAEGSTREVGHDTGLSLKLISFEDEYYPEGAPKDYRSQVILYENGQEVKRALVRVNYPMVYKGTRFYQSFFGLSVQVKILKEGSELYNGGIPLEPRVSQGMELSSGTLELPGGLVVRFVSSEAMGFTDGQLALVVFQDGVETGRGLLERGVPSTLGGLDFDYTADGKYSGFQVSRDPANPLVWIASILFILGLMLVFYFPYRQIWVFLQNTKGNRSRVLLRMGATRSPGASSELEKMTVEIEKELLLKKSNKTKEAN